MNCYLEISESPRQSYIHHRIDDKRKQTFHLLYVHVPNFPIFLISSSSHSSVLAISHLSPSQFITNHTPSCRKHSFDQYQIFSQ